MAPKRKSRSTAAATAAAGAQDEDVATTTTPAPASMAGAVVFGLHHLRQAIFGYHADVIVERRKEVLGAIDRPNSDLFATELSYDSYRGEHPRRYFSGVRRFLENQTKLFDITKKLGLHEASWLDYLLDNSSAANLWLTAHTSIARGRASGRDEFEIHPQSRQGSGSSYEHPTANPMEMFHYAVTGQGYHRGSTIWRSANHAEAILLRDDRGRTYIMNFTVSAESSFMLQAASRCPELLFGDDSPFWPVYDTLYYDESKHVGAVVSQAPPWPLSRRLAPGIEGQEELRRILERARDLFSHLATLHKLGISLDGQPVQRDWTTALAYDTRDPAQKGPWLLPAYLERSCKPNEEGKLNRVGHFDEKLPAASLDAWPGAGKSTCNLPWSQFSAYMDPRVPGPRTYLYGVASAQWDDESFKRRMKANATAADGQSSSSKLVPEERFQEDTISVAQFILEDFFRTYVPSTMTQDQRLELLETTHPSDAYEACLRAPAGLLHGPSKSAPSPVFLFCPQCARKDASKAYPPFDGTSASIIEGRCPQCYTGQVVTAMPMTVRHLLLRILRPTTDAEGNMVVVTAKEAHDTLEAVLESETDKIEGAYKAWCQVQERVVRLDHPRELDLNRITMDDSSHRVLLLEHLRGNLLQDNLRRSEWSSTRRIICNDLTALQKKKQVELRAACGDKEAAAALAVKIEEEEKAAAATAAAALVKEEKGEEKEEEPVESDEEYSPSSSKKKGKRGGKGGAAGGSKKKAKK